MSRNLCRSGPCANCGSDFMPRRLPVSDPGMLTEEAYFREIGWWPNPYFGNHGHGWICGAPRAVLPEPRFRRNDCPVCGCPHAGWYMLVRAGSTNEWELFDSSYWFAFNDEPSDRDDAETHPVKDCDCCKGLGKVRA